MMNAPFFPCLELAQSVRTKSPFHIRSPNAHAKSIRLRGAPSQDGTTPRFFHAVTARTDSRAQSVRTKSP